MANVLRKPGGGRRAGERTVGGLVLYHRQMRTYRREEIHLLETFAQQLAGGIDASQPPLQMNVFDSVRGIMR